MPIGFYKFRQTGVSLVPALITICIFTLLTSQVIVPNNMREANETNIKSIAKSAENLIQASLAYHAKNKSWPTSIKKDLVPKYLPFFEEDYTLWGGRWGIIKYDQKKNRINDTSAKTPTHISFAVTTPKPEIAQELALRIGGNAQLTKHNPSCCFIDSKPFTVVEVYPVTPGTTTVDDLDVGQDLTVGGNIIITGNIIKPGGSSSPLIDSSKKYDGTSDPSITAHSHSSKRFKQNIYPLDTPIESIYQLKPVSFDYKEPFTEYKTANAANQEIGLIAEQVLPLIPEIALVKDDKLTGIDDRKLSILLLKAVQDLKIDVEILQQNNQQLQKQINGLNRDSQKVATLVDLDEMR